ncbi:porin [Methylobacterium platani]|uniref:Porin n=2 Tax=Methylobacterium platani TaxID=427683 RepID=A0A179S2M0_9HYPH|nr:porin [Methylobacterium platani]KMO19511.1 porin [Methylobacterium platani JCM 14648]OAS19928.1 porin [Methylobacterium platani]
MKLVKSLLLGSAAGLTVVAGAQAADLPIKKAAPVEFVRVCSAYGAGFFFVPGTDTCLRVSGRARFEAGYSQGYTRTGNNGDLMGYRGLGRLNLDARTQTAYGTLRAFVRFELASRTGAYLTSGTQNRIANGFPGIGVDTFGRSQQYVNVDKAFIQFAGLTAGRAASFYDFYAHDFEIIGTSLGSDVASTNLLAYTATFGNGFSATVSVEDPIFRKTPLFGTATAGNTASSFAVFTSATANVTPVVAFANGVPVGEAFYDLRQTSRMPDFVGALRYDAAWGSAQLSAAVHELNAGNASTVLGFGGAAIAAGSVITPRVNSEYGWAVQGGLKFNLPFIAAGDALYLQGSYGEGAQLYTGYSSYIGSYTVSAGNTQGSPFATYFADAAVNPLTGRMELSTSWTVVGSYLHYWAPEWRSAVIGSYGEMSFGKTSRNLLGALNFNGLGNPVNSPGAFLYSAALRDTSQIVVGANLIWSPVKDLDIGVEGLYNRVDLKGGAVVDQNKVSGLAVAGVNAAGLPIAANGAVLPTAKSADTFNIRMRVQRDF